MTTATLPPTDTLFSSEWYLKNAAGPDLRVTDVWPDYTGKGIMVAILDDGFDMNHADLAGHFSTSLNHDFVDGDTILTPGPANNHGTPVAGVIAASNNGIGTVGVAYDATLVGLRISFGSDATEQMYDGALNAMKTVDIANNSWGYVEPFSDSFTAPFFDSFKTHLLEAVQMGRDGLGTIVVFAGGNSAASGDNSNYHNLQNSPYTIAVAALDSYGNHALFSTPGTSILVSAPGAAIVTTDITATGGYFPGDYVTTSGTSFAAPMVSGVVALMLQANPDLGYRDVQEILAYAARKVGNGTDWQTNDATNWNGGGLHYSPSYGFGMVDAHAAVRLAETWNTSASTYENQFTLTKTNNVPVIIPDTGTATSTITLNTDVILDHVEINIDIAHANASQLKIILIAPDGTQSVLADHAPTTAEFPTFTFSTVADWGEHARGTWTLQVTDTVAGTTGTLDHWSITAMGDAPTNNDTYIYTDENTGLIAVNDINGGIDTINAAAMTKNISLTLAANVENLFTGDGRDFVTGNALSNTIDTGRGNDVIHASGGNDTIDGGAGTDLYQSDSVFNASVTVNADHDITLTSLSDGTTTRLQNIEGFVFAGVSYDLPALVNAGSSGVLTDVIYVVHGTAGIALRESTTNGSDAFTASDLNIGGAGVVLLSDRSADHLTLTNNAGANLSAISMRMDQGLNLTVRGFNEVSLIADGAHATSIDVAGGQRGFIQTGDGNDTVDFLAFLIDQNAPAQNRTLTAHTGGGSDNVSITDRSSYLAYDIDLGAGNDHFTAKGTQGGHILGGLGADTFEFGQNNGLNTGIYDFSVDQGDKLDLTLLLENHNPDDPIANFIELSTSGNNTTVKVDHTAVITLYGTTLTDSVQHYLDANIIQINLD